MTTMTLARNLAGTRGRGKCTLRGRAKELGDGLWAVNKCGMCLPLPLQVLTLRSRLCQPARVLVGSRNTLPDPGRGGWRRGCLCASPAASCSGGLAGSPALEQLCCLH